jgi:glycosyltransferase involved in cell wall biosynthesis
VRLGRILSAEADHLVANSAAGLDLHLRLGYRPPATSVIPNGIDVRPFRAAAAEREAVRRELGIAADTLVAVLPARLHPMKEHWTFAAALAQAPGIVGLAIGEGTERLPDRPNMIRLGYRPDVPRLLAAADMVVSTSAYGEGFSNAVAEGMAAGLPAVATDVGDARAILAETGFVVPPRDPGAVANAMRTLAARPWLRERMGAAAAARIAEHFTFERCVTRFRSLYDEVGAYATPHEVGQCRTVAGSTAGVRVAARSPAEAPTMERAGSSV